MAQAREDTAGARESTAQRLDRRSELLEAIVLAVAAVLTAWTAFPVKL